jgi:trigger factor
MKIREEVEMKVTLDRTESLTSYLIVEPEASEIRDYVESVSQRWLKRLEVPGFAKGAAPIEALEQHVSREDIIEEAIKEWAHKIYPKVIKEQNIDIWLQPMVTVIQKEPPKLQIAVALKPIVEICDYHNLKIAFEPLEVNEEEINNILEKSRLQLADHQPVDRPIQEGDLVDFDIEGIASGSMFLNKKGLRAQIMSNFAPEIPGLYKIFFGLKKGEEKEFKLELPANFKQKIVAGTEANFSVKINEIREVSLPALNNEFVQQVAPGAKSLDDLKERIRYNLKKEKEQNAAIKHKEKIVETLIENSKVEFPFLMVDLQANDLVNEYMQQIRSSCKDEKEYEEKTKEINEDKIKENARLLAKKRISWSLVLDEVAKSEGVEVADEEIAEEIDGMTNSIRDEAKKKEARRTMHRAERDNIIDIIKARKTINKLAEIYKI